jgi:type VI secretion system secreted protein Hcp
MGIYMKFGNIQGDATQQGFEKWINISSFQWPNAVQREISHNTGRGRNREPKQPAVSSITVTKEVDHASGPLYKSLCAVSKAEECKIAFLRTDEGGEGKYIEYTLTDTLLEKLSLSGGDHSTTEDWTLNFTAISMEVFQLDKANVARGPYRFKYDKATGKGG